MFLFQYSARSLCEYLYIQDDTSRIRSIVYYYSTNDLDYIHCLITNHSYTHFKLRLSSEVLLYYK